MTTDEGSEIPGNNLADWLGVEEEDSIPFIPSFLYEDITNCDWWAHHSSDTDPNYLFDLPPSPSPSNPLTQPQTLPPPKLSKKRQRRPNPTDQPPLNDNNNNNNNTSHTEVNRNTGSRKGGGKVTAGGSNSASKEVRWAEQLLNPLASAIETHNLSRVQHLLYVLQELASPTADANHRLASHGLRALTRHLSTPFTGGAAPTFATTDPELFRSALIRFNEVSPWFAFHNSLANNSILQILTADSATNQRTRNLHVVDIGVSHGIQWPTMLEPLTRRSNGPPSLVRLTVAGDVIPPGPFSSPPQGYDFPSRLLRYAKSLDLNLKIDRVSDLSPQSLSLSRDEVLVVCVQFRAHRLDIEQRMAILRSIRELEPDLVILTEIDGGDGATSSGFGKRAEVVWRFLDSTSAAFKGRDCNERRVVEGEMARILEQGVELGEGRERWKERMEGVGFREDGFGEEAVDGGRALLRKYDGNWEMRLTAVGGRIGLWWKGQPVSFCSVWKTVRGG